MLSLMYNCEIRKETMCYVHYLRSTWDLLNLVITLVNVYDVN